MAFVYIFGRDQITFLPEPYTRFLVDALFLKDELFGSTLVSQLSKQRPRHESQGHYCNDCNVFDESTKVKGQENKLLVKTQKTSKPLEDTAHGLTSHSTPPPLPTGHLQVAQDSTPRTNTLVGNLQIQS